MTDPTPTSDGSEGHRPVPDPTVLTTDALRREIAGLEKLVDFKLEAAEKLRNERFHSLDVLMDRVEVQRREQKADTAAAVEAALDSQKEATAKMERSISDQLASLRSNFETSLQSIHTTVGDLKDRVTALESIKQGQTEQRTESRQINAGTIAAIGVGVAVLMAVLAIVAYAAGIAGAEMVSVPPAPTVPTVPSVP